VAIPPIAPRDHQDRLLAIDPRLANGVAESFLVSLHKIVIQSEQALPSVEQEAWVPRQRPVVAAGAVGVAGGWMRFGCRGGWVYRDGSSFFLARRGLLFLPDRCHELGVEQAAPIRATGPQTVAFSTCGKTQSTCSATNL